MTAPVHLVVPRGVDDPASPSGGNVYDRRLADGLRARGRRVHEHHTVPAGLDATLATIPDGALALVDGLVGCFAAAAMERHAARLRLVVLAHMSFGEVGDEEARQGEERALAAADLVVTVSSWTRERLLARYSLDPVRVHVAEPGADPAPLATGTKSGERLLSVGAVTPAKGWAVLLEALRRVTDLDWACTCVGSLDREPSFAAQVRETAPEAVSFTGPLVGPDLVAAYDAADLLVVPTLAESFGIVAVEALARGIPVVASDVGGLPEALGRLPDGRVPGCLVPPGDAGALAAALRTWLTDPGIRSSLRSAAAERRTTVGTWEATAASVDALLDVEAARPSLTGAAR